MTIVNTQAGAVEGEARDGLHVFRSIPYAESTASQWRFRPARPKAPWTGVLSCRTPRAVAPQLLDVAYAMSGSSVEHLCNEDCLELNVWTPGVDGAKRPVMVWIHGGGYLYGSSHDDDYNGTALALAGDVVVVTINYRLGIFAHLHLADVGGEEFRDSGVLSVTDQAEALRWVQANIAAFGGDPGNVTIFGESCGAFSVSNLMASPLGKGLFRRVIAMSGSAGGRSPKTGAEVTEAILRHANVTSVAELQAMSMRQVLDLQAWAIANLGLAEATFIPVLGVSPVLPADPIAAIAAGSASGIDLMTGYTKDEMRFWTLYYPDLLDRPDAAVTSWAKELFDDKAGRVLETFARARPEETLPERACSIIASIVFGYMTDRQAVGHAAHTPRTFLYRFDWQTTAMGGRLGTPHAAELPFVFDTFDISWGKMVAEDDTPARRRMFSAFQRAFLAFARTGNPHHDGLPAWRPYDEESRAMMIFGETIRLVDNPIGAEIALWDEIIGPENVGTAPSYFHFPVDDSYPTEDAAKAVAAQAAE